MTLGKSIRYLRDTLHPAESPNTDLVAAAIACGFKLAPNGYHRAQNEDGTGHNVVWSMDGEGKVHFKPSFREEILSFDEFRARFESLEWCQENRDHPISYLRAGFFQKRSLMTRLREILPLQRRKRGKRELYLDPNATPEERQKWENEFNKPFRKR